MALNKVQQKFSPPALDEQLSDARKIVQPGILQLDTISSAKNDNDPLSCRPIESVNSSPQEIQRFTSIWNWVWKLFGGTTEEPPKKITPEEAREAKAFIDAVNELVAAIQQDIGKRESVSEEEEQELFEAENALNELDRLQIHSREREYRLAKHQLTVALVKSRELTNERKEKIDKLFEAVKKQKLWGTFEEVASTFALGATSIAVTLANPPLGSLLFLFAMGTTVDRMCDHAAKKKVVDLVFGQNSENHEAWVERIKLGLGLVTIGATFFGGMSMSPWVSAISGATQFGKAVSEKKRNVSEADLIELRETIIKNDEKIKKAVGAVDNIAKKIHHHYKNIHSAQKNNLELKVALVGNV